MNSNYIIFAQAETTAQPAVTVQQTSSTAEVQPASVSADQQPAPNPLLSFAPFLIIIALFIYMSWRGQKKEAKRQQDMMNSIRKDVKVMTTGGLIGVVAEVKEDSYLVDFAPNVRIAVARSSISKVLSAAAPAAPVASEKDSGKGNYKK